MVKRRKETKFEYRIKLDIEDVDFLISHGIDPRKMINNLIKLLVEKSRNNLDTLEKGLKIDKKDVRKIRGNKPILLEVFRDFEIKVYNRKVDPANFTGRLEIHVFSKRNNAKRITLEDLKKYAETLNNKYPGENFYIRRVKIEHKILYVLTKKKRVAKQPCVDIYFDLEDQRFFVPKKLYEKQPRLVNYILFRTLGALGVVSRVETIPYYVS